jgi:putative phage-type endonuclease
MSLTDEEKRLIGGSDVSALVGLNPYKTPVDVWRRIVEGYEVEETDAMMRGTLLEPVIREWYRRKTGALLRGPQKLSVAGKPWCRANLDDVVVRDEQEKVLECKSASIRVAHRWGIEADDAPEEYLAQTQFYMWAARIPFADLAVLIGGDDFRIFPLQADLEFQSLLVEAAERFWKDYVLTRRPPPVDSSESYAAWLASRHPKEAVPAIPANAEAHRWAIQLREARLKLEEAEARKSEATNALKALCGDAAGLVGDGWRVSWKRNKDGVATDWEAVVREAGVPQSLIQKHTAVKPGPRVFRPTFSNGDK